MRQLNQQTAEVLKEINDDGRPAMITKRGRFIAMIVPLVAADIESTVVGAIVDEFEHSRQLTGEYTLENLRTTDAITDELDVNLPDYPDRDA
jgi:prevent-host-death family protein